MPLPSGVIGRSTRASSTPESQSLVGPDVNLSCIACPTRSVRSSRRSTVKSSVNTTGPVVGVGLGGATGVAAGTGDGEAAGLGGATGVAAGTGDGEAAGLDAAAGGLDTAYTRAPSAGAATAPHPARASASTRRSARITFDLRQIGR